VKSKEEEDIVIAEETKETSAPSAVEEEQSPETSASSSTPVKSKEEEDIVTAEETKETSAPSVVEEEEERPSSTVSAADKNSSISAKEISNVSVTVLPSSSLAPSVKKSLLAVTLLTVNVRHKAAGLWAAIKKGAGKKIAAVRSGSSVRWEGIMKLIVREKSNDPLPFLPTPAVSEIPGKGDEATIKMWKEVQKGDQVMIRATTAKSLRDRNRLIDRAIICYAQAQAHKTNETLYHNWGLALLAKALHVAPKKRASFYNAAVDKFLAGNVVAPHYFDFYLASLYAIIGNKEECLKWLKVARESGKLDAESLMQAPDFDLVRGEPWFDEFIQH